MDARALLRVAVEESLAVKRRMIESNEDLLLLLADDLTSVLQKGGTIYICGNGGSASDAQHVAAEFVGRFLRERRALPAVALTANTSILTAVGNDYGFDSIFARQVQACVTDKDAVVGISTSGRSENVLEAIRVAQDFGALTIGFTGEPGDPLASSCDLCLKVPSEETPRIQEAHILAWHILCDLIERQFCE